VRAVPTPPFQSGLKLILKESSDPLPGALSYSLNAPANGPKPANEDQTRDALTPGLYEIAVQQNGQEVYRKQIIAIEGQTSDLELTYKKADGFSLRQTLQFPQIKFVPGQKKIAKPSYQDLKKLVRLLQAEEGIELFGFEVHTDSNGDAEKNQELTDARAVEVRNYLVKNGVDAQRVKARGFGATQPFASNETAAGRLQNRRVEFVVLETSAKPKLLGDR